MTIYPAQIDTIITLPKALDLITPITGGIFNDLRDAILGIEQALGVNPAGIYGTVANRLTTLENIIIQGGGVATPVGPAGGDLGNAYPNPSVIGIQGNSISSAQPTDGELLTWVASHNRWEPKQPIVTSGFTAGGDLSGTSTNQTVIGIDGHPISITSIQPGDIIVYNGSSLVNRPDVFLNVLDYGVKGDGSTDDTAAIQAIFDNLSPVINGANVTVYFPSRPSTGMYYKITQPLVLQRGSARLLGENVYGSIIRSDGFCMPNLVLSDIPFWPQVVTSITGSGNSMITSSDPTSIELQFFDLRDIPNVADQVNLTGLSVESTFQIDTLPSGYQFLYSHAGSSLNPSTAQNTLQFGVQAGSDSTHVTVNCFLHTSTGTQSLSIVDATTLGTPIHVAMCWDGTNLTLYAGHPGSTTTHTSAALGGTYTLNYFEGCWVGAGIPDQWPVMAIYYAPPTGKIDSLRLSNFSRYSGNFTAPTGKLDTSTGANQNVGGSGKNTLYMTNFETYKACWKGYSWASNSVQVTNYITNRTQNGNGAVLNTTIEKLTFITSLGRAIQCVRTPGTVFKDLELYGMYCLTFEGDNFYSVIENVNLYAQGPLQTGATTRPYAIAAFLATGNDAKTTNIGINGGPAFGMYIQGGGTFDFVKLVTSGYTYVPLYLNTTSGFTTAEFSMIATDDEDVALYPGYPTNKGNWICNVYLGRNNTVQFNSCFLSTEFSNDVPVVICDSLEDVSIAGQITFISTSLTSSEHSLSTPTPVFGFPNGNTGLPEVAVQLINCVKQASNAWTTTAYGPYVSAFDPSVNQLTLAAGQTLVYDGYNWINRADTYKNVLDYGVVGDSVTDDSAAIQALINAAGTGVGEPTTLYFPAKPGGYYSLSHPLVLPNNSIKLLGDSQFSSLLRSAAGYVMPLIVISPEAFWPISQASITGTGNSMICNGSGIQYIDLRDVPWLVDLYGLSAMSFEMTIQNDVAITDANTYPIYSHSGRAYATTGGLSFSFQIALLEGSDGYHSNLNVYLATTGTTANLTIPNIVVLGTPIHIAVCWDGTNLTVYHGAPGATTTHTSTSCTGLYEPSFGEGCWLGGGLSQDWPNLSPYFGSFIGKVDSFRVSNFCRYTTDFTAPAGKISNTDVNNGNVGGYGNNTLFLSNFDTYLATWKAFSWASNGGLTPVFITNRTSNGNGGVVNVTIEKLAIQSLLGRGIQCMRAVSCYYKDLLIYGTYGITFENDQFYTVIENVDIIGSGPPLSGARRPYNIAGFLASSVDCVINNIGVNGQFVFGYVFNGGGIWNTAKVLVDGFCFIPVVINASSGFSSGSFTNFSWDDENVAFYPGYPTNKGNWICALYLGSVQQEVFDSCGISVIYSADIPLVTLNSPTNYFAQGTVTFKNCAMFGSQFGTTSPVFNFAGTPDTGPAIQVQQCIRSTPPNAWTDNTHGTLVSVFAPQVNQLILAPSQTIAYNGSNWINRQDAFINVLDFGAKGDSTTDDTMAIQAAIDYCASIGGGKVYLPSRSSSAKYITSKPLVISTSHIELFGDSRDISWIYSTVPMPLISIADPHGWPITGAALVTGSPNTCFDVTNLYMVGNGGGSLIDLRKLPSMDLDGLTGLSVECTIKVPNVASFGGAGYIIASKGCNVGATTYAFQFFLTASDSTHANLAVYINTSNGTYNTTLSNVVVNNIATHVAFCYDGSNLHLFAGANGSTTTTTSVAATGTIKQGVAENVTIGMGSAGMFPSATLDGTGSMMGYLDNLRISNFARNTSAYTAPVAKYGTDIPSNVNVGATGHNTIALFLGETYKSCWKGYDFSSSSLVNIYLQNQLDTIGVGYPAGTKVNNLQLSSINGTALYACSVPNIRLENLTVGGREGVVVTNNCFEGIIKGISAIGTLGVTSSNQWRNIVGLHVNFSGLIDIQNIEIASFAFDLAVTQIFTGKISNAYLGGTYEILPLLLCTVGGTGCVGTINNVTITGENIQLFPGYPTARGNYTSCAALIGNNVSWNDCVFDTQFCGNIPALYISPASGYPVGNLMNCAFTPNHTYQTTGNILFASAPSYVLSIDNTLIGDALTPMIQSSQATYISLDDNVSPLKISTGTSSTITNLDVYVNVNVSSPYNLTTSANPYAGQRLVVKDQSGHADTNHITITANSGQTIDGNPTASIITARGSLTLIYDGIFDWIIT